MESKYQHTVNGQEIIEADINSISENAALADDRVIAELMRPQPYNGVAIKKSIVPFAVSAPDGDAVEADHSMIRPYIGGVRVNPFRAIIGSSSLSSAGGKANWQDIRSAIAVGTTTRYQFVPIGIDTGSPGGARFDLIYAAVSVDDSAAAVARKVKDPTTLVVATSNLVTQVATTVTLGAVKGTEGSDAKPSLPADGGGTYYIPLAYVGVPAGFTAATLLGAESIWEFAETTPLSPATGAATMRPVEGQYSPSIGVELIDPWTGTPARPATHLPSIMTGVEALMFMLDLTTTTGPNWTKDHYVDRTRDWRNRIWRWTAQLLASDAAAIPAMDPSAGVSDVPCPSFRSDPAGAILYQETVTGLGNSMCLDTSASRLVPVYLDELNTQGISNPDWIELYVDASSGDLMVDWSTSAPNLMVFFWLEASGPFHNV